MVNTPHTLLLSIAPQGPALSHGKYRPRPSRHRLSRRVDVLHPLHVCSAFETDDELSKLAGKRNFGERAEAIADRDQAERGACDERIARLADAGGNHHAHERIGV